MSIIDDYMKGKASRSVTLRDLQCFVGMLQTGEATLQDFADRDIDLELIGLRIGSSNYWTGPNAKLASKLIDWLREHKEQPQ